MGYGRSPKRLSGALLSIAFIGLQLAYAQQTDRHQRSNFVLILGDDMGFSDIGTPAYRSILVVLHRGLRFGA